MKESSTKGLSKRKLYFARAVLSDADWRFLMVVLHAGGYLIRRQAVSLGLRDSPAKTYEQLRELVGFGFLEQVKLFPNPKSPRAYKLTARALRCLGQVNSHIRRRHTEETILYKLLRLQFLCEKQKDGRIALAYEDREKLRIFKEQGFFREFLPVKNGGLKEIIGLDKDSISIYHIDRFRQDAKAQLEDLLRDYRKAITSGGNGLRFIVVVPSEQRQAVYRFLIKTLGKMNAPELDTFCIKTWPFSRRRQALAVEIAVKNAESVAV